MFYSPYCSGIFLSSNPKNMPFDFVFTNSPIILEENDYLYSIPSEDEIRGVNSMGPLKVLGSDGV